jgi:hypothetical protein
MFHANQSSERSMIYVKALASLFDFALCSALMDFKVRNVIVTLESCGQQS